MGVDRCICRDVSFARIQRVAQEIGPELSKLREATGCGSGCGMCVPYIKRMLITGKTNVPVMTHREIEALVKDEHAAAG
ncbi:MAG: hypothetical protein GC200_08685 [Tepidisphaera sp.]|nr:hypothetical protein [Tepidisphaera sp.]